MEKSNVPEIESVSVETDSGNAESDPSRSEVGVGKDSALKAADTRNAGALLTGWGWEPSRAAIKEVSRALTDARTAERERCAKIAETAHSEAIYGDDEILRKVIAAAIRATAQATKSSEASHSHGDTPASSLPAAEPESVTCAKCGRKRLLSTLESKDTFVCRYCLSTEPAGLSSPATEEIEAIKARRAAVNSTFHVNHFDNTIRIDGRCGMPVHEGCTVLRWVEHEEHDTDNWLSFFAAAPEGIDRLLSALSESEGVAQDNALLLDERTAECDSLRTSLTVALEEKERAHEEIRDGAAMANVLADNVKREVQRAFQYKQDADALRAELATAKGEIERLQGWQEGLQETTLTWAELGVKNRNDTVDECVEKVKALLSGHQVGKLRDIIIAELDAIKPEPEKE